MIMSIDIRKYIKNYINFRKGYPEGASDKLLERILKNESLDEELEYDKIKFALLDPINKGNEKNKIYIM